MHSLMTARVESQMVARQTRRAMFYLVLLVLILIAALAFFMSGHHTRRVQRPASAYVVLNRLGDVVEVSPAAATLLGRDVVGAPFTSLIDPAPVRDRARQDFAAAVAYPPQRVRDLECSVGSVPVMLCVHELERGSRYLAELRRR